MNTETLRWYTYQLGLPTDRLARLLGIHHDTLRHWLDGDRQPPKWIIYPLVMELWYLRHCRGENSERMFDANHPSFYRTALAQCEEEMFHQLRNHMDICNRVLQDR